MLHIGFGFRAFLNPNRSGSASGILRRVRIQYPLKNLNVFLSTRNVCSRPQQMRHGDAFGHHLAQRQIGDLLDVAGEVVPVSETVGYPKLSSEVQKSGISERGACNSIEPHLKL